MSPKYQIIFDDRQKSQMKQIGKCDGEWSDWRNGGSRMKDIQNLCDSYVKLNVKPPGNARE